MVEPLAHRSLSCNRIMRNLKHRAFNTMKVAFNLDEQFLNTQGLRYFLNKLCEDGTCALLVSTAFILSKICQNLIRRAITLYRIKGDYQLLIISL